MNAREKRAYTHNKGLKSLEISLNRSVFSDDNYFLFVFKKTEKLLTALYMVTNLFLNDDPIKWKLRSLGLGLLSSSLAIRDKSSVEGKEIIVGIISKAAEIISLLEVATIAGLVSEMNLSILKKEFLFLVDTLDSLKKSSYSGDKFVLPTALFDISDYLGDEKETNGLETKPAPIIDENRLTDLGTENKLNESAKGAASEPIAKGHYKGQDIKDISSALDIKRTEIVKRVRTISSQKDIRRNLVINTLKKREGMSLADFSRIIPDCSEKTIQRILTELIAKGVVVRSGKKRWSIYSLKS